MKTFRRDLMMCAAGMAGITAGAAHAQCVPELSSLPGLNSTVQGLAVFDDGTGPALYAAGAFSEAGGVPASRIARWDGTSWAEVGGGVNNTVFTTPVVFDDGSGPALYIGGNFTEAGGVPAERLARWDGTSWSEFGGGAEGNVSVLGVFDLGSGPALYAAGSFTVIGGVSANRIARWDGQGWSALGDGLASTVNALEAFDDGTGVQLYVGGAFANAAGLPDTNRIARWDGQNWSAVPGSALNNSVRSLTAFDDGSGPALFIVGQFSSAGGATAQRIVRWDGQTWDPLGTGATSTVASSGVFDFGTGPQFYIGGSFGAVNGVTDANRLARWDGQAWSPLQDGLSSGNINSFAVFDDGTGPALYAGGTFTQTTAGVALERIVRWGCPAAPTCYADCDGNGTLNVDDFMCFINAFAQQDPYADCDGNGLFNIDDFMCFVNEFSQGCP